MRIRLAPGIFLSLVLVLTALPEPVDAHGGVVEEDDLCVIKIGYLKAHFKIYVPAETGHEQYCEDIPMRGESVFVMEYQHDGLSDTEIDFRIIENVTGMGQFARLEDVAAIADLDAVTVRYEAPAVVPDVFTLLQAFDTDGEFIGIISATRRDTGIRYTAVFPFEVGYTGVGIWPWFIGALLILQFNYWFMSRRRAQSAAAVLLVGLLGFADVGAEESPVISRGGHFVVSFAADIEPLTINRIHNWTLTITSASGEPVLAADIEISGGMPAHNHGLPTRPRVTQDLGGGAYRVEGMRFHMAGDWEIRVTIDDGSVNDELTLALSVE